MRGGRYKGEYRKSLIWHAVRDTSEQRMIVDVTASFSPFALSDVDYRQGSSHPPQRAMNTLFTRNQVQNQFSDLSARLFSHVADVQLHLCC